MAEVYIVTDTWEFGFPLNTKSLYLKQKNVRKYCMRFN